MIKIAICDDDKIILDLLKKEIDTVCSRKNLMADSMVFTPGYFISNILILAAQAVLTLLKPRLPFSERSLERSGFAAGIISGIIGMILVLIFSVLQVTGISSEKSVPWDPILIVVALTGILFFLHRKNESTHSGKFKAGAAIYRITKGAL